jgi:hypothetical protein
LNRHGNSFTKEKMESCHLKDSSYSLMQRSILMFSKKKDLKIAFLMNSWKLFKLGVFYGTSSEISKEEFIDYLKDIS